MTTKSIQVTQGTPVHESWLKVNHYCPHCGEQDVWQHQPVSPSASPEHICTNCEVSYVQSAGIEEEPSVLTLERVAGLTA